MAASRGGSHLTLPTTPRTSPISDILAFLALGLAVVIAAGGLIYAQRVQRRADATRLLESGRLRDERGAADQERTSIVLAAREEAHRLRSEAEAEVRERRAEMARLEQRSAQRDEALERRNRDVEQGEQRLGRREEELEQLRQGLEEERANVGVELQRIAGLSQEEARAELLSEVQGELDHEIAERIRAAEQQVREEAQERGREILIATMQRHASEQTGEAAVTVLHLPSEDLKGRIIGREGRNIRALEAATGIDVIVDETPEAVVLSGFDPVRREVAKVTLERLFADGRIHPARIEEVAAKSRAEIGDRLREEGEAACQELGITGVHPELVKLLGTLHFRSAYGTNVLTHSKDTAAVAGMIAAEIGYDVQEAREIGLFHDIGQAVEQHVEGSHAFIGGEILARLGRPARVVHAVRAHHYDEEPRTIGAFILMTADAITASRRGARRESLASSIKRLERIEQIADSMPGVDRSFAIQAGKELRVMVKPEEVDDDRAQIMAREIAKRLHAEASYAGRIKVVVLRETRSIEYAK
ncbi:MAG: ribonuclease Y [Candidatus Dormibacteria bacterium]|jgi:ribonuclease Y